MAGQYSVPPLPDFQVSQLALVEKKAKGFFRLIHNLSYPEVESVNDQIEKFKGSIKYQTLDDAIQTILTLAPGCVLSKTDIHHAFKIIPVQQTGPSLESFGNPNIGLISLCHRAEEHHA